MKKYRQNLDNALQKGAKLIGFPYPSDAPDCPSTNLSLVQFPDGYYEWIGIGLGEPDGDKGESGDNPTKVESLKAVVSSFYPITSVVVR